MAAPSAIPLSNLKSAWFPLNHVDDDQGHFSPDNESHLITFLMDRQYATLTGLWNFYFLFVWWLNIRHLYASTHVLLSVQQPMHSPAAKTQISFITKMPWFRIHYCICSSSAALMVKLFSSRLFSLHSDTVAIFADTQLLLSLSLVDSSLLRRIWSID